MTCVAWIAAVAAALAGPVVAFDAPGVALGVPCAASLALVGLSRETIRRDERRRARRAGEVEAGLQRILLEHQSGGR